MGERLAICPFCRFPIKDGRVCANPDCGKVLDKGDWSIPEVWSSTGLLPPTNGCGPFQLPEVANGSGIHAGKLLSPLPLELDPRDAVYHIGGSLDCHIQIFGAASPRQVTLHIHRRTGEWWAFDHGDGSDVTINGERFRNRRLKDDDILYISGIRLCYRAGQIAAEYGSANGVGVVVSRLTDARMSYSNPSRPLLDRVSFVARSGEFVGIIGPSGCGKSTLLKTIAGLVNPASGSIAFNGVARSECPDAIRACTAYLPQRIDAALRDELTLAQEIHSYSAIHNIDNNTNREESLLRELGLSGNSRIGDMSGGQRRRAAFLLALLRSPSVLLLDEPTAGLDRATETALMEDLRRMACSGARKTILCATHELANIRLFDRILVMANGVLVYNGKPNKVFDALSISCEGTERFKQLYERLDDIEGNMVIQSLVRQNIGTIPEPSHPTPPVPPEMIGGWARCMSGYLTRFWLSFVSFARRPLIQHLDGTLPAWVGCASRQFVKWIFNLPLVLFVWQPLLVALCLCVALREKYGEDDATVFFGGAIAALWLGMSGSVRSLVSARPCRCLEWLDGVSRTAYLFAVLSSSLVRGLVQGTMLTAFLYLIPYLYGFPTQWESASLAVIGIWCCLVAVEWMGGVLGMALSAMAPSETFAVTMVPNLAVVALFFSEPLMGENGVSWLAKVLPAHAAHKAMFAINDPVAVYDWWILPSTVMGWFVVSLVIVSLAQTLHEHKWKG